MAFSSYLPSFNEFLPEHSLQTWQYYYWSMLPLNIPWEIDEDLSNEVKEVNFICHHPHW